MVRWAPPLQDWIERAELLGAGLDRLRVDARQALTEGRGADARGHALDLLEERPTSRAGLGLWVEAAASLGLDDERLEALERLSRLEPDRADVWLALADARAVRGDPTRAELERAAAAGAPRAAADAARLRLAYADVRAGDPDRAERWIDALGIEARQALPAALARADALLARGDAARAEAALAGRGDPHPLDTAGTGVRARVAAARRGPDALRWVVRALVLDAPGALDAAITLVARADPDERAVLERIVAEVGRAGDPRWIAALAEADGDPARGLASLADAVQRGAAGPALTALVRAAVRARAETELRLAVRAAAEAGTSPGPGAPALVAALAASAPGGALAAVETLCGDTDEGAWAAELRCAAYARWLPLDAPAAWSELGAELAELCRALGATEEARAVEQIELERARPLRVAVIGEFNAGKSSFVNALLGQQVAPVGVVPTTATVNHLAWAGHRFARVVPSGLRPERVVAFEELGRALAELPPSEIDRVVLHAPIEWLRRVEIVDTPGRNAPDPAHSAASRRAVVDAHAVLFLLDATRPLSRSEADALAEVSAGGLPVVVLVNKIDRLSSDEQLEAALAHVRAGVAEAAGSGIAGVAALSARLALQGRAGDADALGRSRWAEVEALLESKVVSRSATLRERALRSRARALVARLQVRSGTLAAGAAERARRAAERRERSRAALDAMEAHGDRVEDELAEEVSAGMAALKAEWAPHSGTLEALAGRRFVARRAEGLALRLVDRVADRVGIDGGVAEPWRGRVLPVATALVRALAPALRVTSGSAGADPQGVEPRWLAALLVEECAAALTALAAEPAPAEALGPVRRLEALAAALAAAGELGVEGGPVNGEPRALVSSAR
ncbi:MAG: dynamin family protein [Polyangiaceae bacterium]|nr:dynamin family protein [Polyangiaceae bacterium]